MLTFENELKQLAKIKLIVAEINKLSDRRMTEEEAIRLAQFTGRAHSVIHGVQVIIENKNIINHEIEMLVEEWNDCWREQLGFV